MPAPAQALHEPFEDLARQSEANAFGLWIFLASEVLLFGGLFLTIFTYRLLDPKAFAAAAAHTNIWFGTLNTAILMTSSLSIAVAGRALEQGGRRMARWGIWITLALGLSFLVVKGFEYREDLHERLWPDAEFDLKTRTARLFFSLYWIGTAVHACHVTAGLGCIGRLAWLDRRGKLEANSDSVEVTSLYWHLVDVIWVMLYPLLYLIGR